MMTNTEWKFDYTSTHPESISITGNELRKALVERIRKYEIENKLCFSEVVDILMNAASKSEEGGPTVRSVAETAASLLLSLTVKPKSRLKGKALVVQSWMNKASHLRNEILELSCIAKNLNESTIYTMSMLDALRYGLV